MRAPLAFAFARLLLVGSLIPLAAMAQQSRTELPWRRVVLTNGLTLLMQPDTTVSSVAVQLWVRGGAREEVAGQYGVAHLFEHDVPYAGRFFTADNRTLRARTSTNGGAGTDYDFLRFYGDVMPEGLEATLGALADRMDADSSKFSAEALTRDQAIVMREIGRSNNIDWDLDVMNRLAAGTFGADHPYNHAVTGREADVNAATVTTMRDWQRRFVTASNMLVLLLGNFDPPAAEGMVRRQFGGLRPGTPQPHIVQWVPHPQERRERLRKDVPRGVVYLRWPIPAWGDSATADLGLLARVLTDRGTHLMVGGATDSLSASLDLMEMAGAFTMRGAVARGASADSAEAQMRTLLTGVLHGPIALDELQRAKAADATTFAFSLQRLGDRRDGRADAIGLGELFRGDPDLWHRLRARADDATTESVRDAGRRWLTDRGYVLHVVPQPPGTATPYDRATSIAPAPVRRAAAPRLTDRTLATGMRVIIAERPALPLAQVTLAFDAGSATDTPDHAGRARVALDALTRLPTDARGTTLERALAQLGARTEARLDPDYAVLSVGVVSEHVPAVVRLVAAALRRPAPDALLREVIRDAGPRLDRALADPVHVRHRAMGCIALVPCDPDAFDALGTSAALARLTPAMVRAFYEERYQPGGTLLLLSGRVDPAPLDRQLAQAFAGWGGGAAHRSRGMALTTFASAGASALVDFPNATQTHVLLAQPLPANVAGNPARLQLARIVNLAFRQRLMANLRESKGWSYEVYPFGVESTRGGAYMTYDIPLQPDRVGEAIGEVAKELVRLRTDSLTPGFMSSIATAAASAGVLRDLSSLERIDADLLELARSGLSAPAYVEAYRALGAMSRGELTEAVRSMLDPSRQFWVLAGRRDVVQAELREAGLTVPEVWREP
jgi:zinc protease